MRNQFEIHATLVADEFIDTYMASANGEYVKVYLYILRHQNEKVDLPSIADALNHTEADVRRALAYWEKMGVLGDLGDSAGRARRETAAASAQVPASENTPPSGASFSWPAGRRFPLVRRRLPSAGRRFPLVRRRLPSDRGRRLPVRKRLPPRQKSGRAMAGQSWTVFRETESSASCSMWPDSIWEDC